MREEELHCPSCTKQYSEANPPRLLTMCGHTFCHTCLKVMIVRKKDANFKLRCPVDKQSIELESQSPSCFPKNMAILQIILKKRRQAMLKQGDSSRNQFLYNVAKNSRKSVKQNMKLASANQKMEICLLHQKQLDIVCLADKVKICSDCALFGGHKGHVFSSIKELETNKRQFCKTILEIIDKKNSIQSKISNQEISQEIMSLLEKKKQHVCEQIRIYFQKLRNQINQAQLNIMAQADCLIQQTGDKLQSLTRLNAEIVNVYAIWEGKAYKELKDLDSCDHTKEVDLMVNRQIINYMVYKGNSLLQQMKKQQEQLIHNVELIIQGVKIESKSETLMDVHEYCYFRRQQTESRHLQNQISILGIQECFGQPNVECSILVQHDQQEDISLLESNGFEIEGSQQNQNQCGQLNMTNMSIEPVTAKSKQRNNISRQLEPVNLSMLNNTSKKRRSQESADARGKGSRARTSTSPSNFSMSFKSLLAQKASLKTRALQKYEKAVNQLQKQTAQTIDLYGAQVGDDIMKQIFTKIKQNSKIKIVRLVKNDLSDKCAKPAVESLDNIDTLSLAQNNFTQKFIDVLLLRARQKMYTSPKSVILGHNNIILRKCKQKIQELRKLKVSIVL